MVFLSQLRFCTYKSTNVARVWIIHLCWFIVGCIRRTHEMNVTTTRKTSVEKRRLYLHNVSKRLRAVVVIVCNFWIPRQRNILIQGRRQTRRCICSHRARTHTHHQISIENDIDDGENTTSRKTVLTKDKVPNRLLFSDVDRPPVFIAYFSSVYEWKSLPDWTVLVYSWVDLLQCCSCYVWKDEVSHQRAHIFLPNGFAITVIIFAIMAVCWCSKKVIITRINMKC